MCSLYASSHYFDDRSSALYDTALEFLKNINMPTNLAFMNTDVELPVPLSLFQNLINDKKRTHSFMRFILLRSLHEPQIVNDLPDQLILDSFACVS